MAELIYYCGTMDSGKSTLALQTAHNHRSRGREGVIFTNKDRAGKGLISSRLGLQLEALEVDADLDIHKLIVERLSIGGRISFVICDEAQFYMPEQIEQLAKIVDGFVSASLIFAIGPLAILGSISDGMGTGIDQLVLKSTLDGFTSLAFAASLGWGVALSSLPVGIYQFIWTAIGLFLGSILAGYQVAAMTAVGGVLLIGIALRLLRIKQIAVGNLLPALVLAPLLALAAHQFI